MLSVTSQLSDATCVQVQEATNWRASALTWTIDIVVKVVSEVRETAQWNLLFVVAASSLLRCQLPSEYHKVSTLMTVRVADYTHNHFSRHSLVPVRDFPLHPLKRSSHFIHSYLSLCFALLLEYLTSRKTGTRHVQIGAFLFLSKMYPTGSHVKNRIQ